MSQSIKYKEASLLGLPGELRNRIWEYAFDEQIPSSELDVLRACKIIHQDAGHFAFKKAIFNIPHVIDKAFDDPILHVRSISLSPEMRDCITAIRIRPEVDVSFSGLLTPYKILRQLAGIGIMPTLLYLDLTHFGYVATLDYMQALSNGLLNGSIHESWKLERITIELSPNPLSNESLILQGLVEKDPDLIWKYRLVADLRWCWTSSVNKHRNGRFIVGFTCKPDFGPEISLNLPEILGPIEQFLSSL